MTETSQNSITLTVLTGGLTKTINHQKGLTIADAMNEAGLRIDNDLSYRIDSKSVDLKRVLQAGEEVFIIGKVKGA